MKFNHWNIIDIIGLYVFKRILLVNFGLYDRYKWHKVKDITYIRRYCCGLGCPWIWFYDENVDKEWQMSRIQVIKLILYKKKHRYKLKQGWSSLVIKFIKQKD